MAGDATRTVVDGSLEAVVDAGGRPEVARAQQAPDGTVRLWAQSEAGLERIRAALPLENDHSEFLVRFAHDPLIGEATRRLRGLRPLRVGSVAQALLRAVCGQLIQASRAREIERAVIRRASPSLGRFHAPPSAAELAGFAPAELRALGLGTRRATTLVRLCRTVDLESLHGVPTDRVAARLGREPGLGPWSIGVIALQGLGRYDHGLARDLGLVKLAAALWGRRVEAEESDTLLEPYGEWAGLASVYLLRGMAAGLVPSAAGHEAPDRQRRRLVA
jgi:AraC family transcriptional regulator of adaptative response / DNA-3-methyladenine glycosylase II